MGKGITNGGINSPPYSHGPYRWDQRVQFTQGVSGFDVVGDVWYVDKDVSASGDGKSWPNAFKTITEAFTAAGNDDVILIGNGFYTEAATITITQVGLKVFGINSSGKARGPVGWKTPTAAGPIITVAVDANDVEIGNLCFIATSGQKGIQLGGVATGYVWRTHIHDCSFFGDSTGTYAVAVYGATTTPSAGNFPDVAECVVERCHFYAWVTACTCVYGTRAMVRDNTMFVPASGIGIVHGSGRPFVEISGNIIQGANSGDTGILITGDDDDAVIITDNTINNLATIITQDVSDGGVAGNNWTYGGLATASVADPTS